MTKVKIAVVEDEMIIADNIRQTLEKLGYEVSEPAIDYEEAIHQIHEEKPDLVMLDIQLLGERDGIDLAHELNDTLKLPFIFLTANADKATIERAKTTKPSAYLIKPFKEFDLYASIEIALSNYAKEHERPLESDKKTEFVIKDAFFIKEKDLYLKVMFSDITYMQSDHIYVKVFTEGGREFLMRSSLKELLDTLPSHFWQIHRSYIANLEKLDAINSHYTKISGHEIPIGKSYREALLAKLDVKG